MPLARTLFLIAAALAVIEVIVIAFIPQPDTPGSLNSQLTLLALRAIPAIGAFLVAGAALRPRGSVGLGIALGAGVYLVIGAIVAVAANGAIGIPLTEQLTELGRLLIVQIVAWPEFLVIVATGDYRLG